MGGDRSLRLLLDTHIWLWSRLAPERLVARHARALEDGGNELWLSPISVWETLLLVERGRLELAGDPVAWIRRALDSVPLREAALTREVAFVSRALDLHQDPADRFIAASASVHELTLVTVDDRLLRSTDFETLADR